MSDQIFDPVKTLFIEGDRALCTEFECVWTEKSPERTCQVEVGE